MSQFFDHLRNARYVALHGMKAYRQMRRDKAYVDSAQWRSDFMQGRRKELARVGLTPEDYSEEETAKVLLRAWELLCKKLQDSPAPPLTVTSIEHFVNFMPPGSRRLLKKMLAEQAVLLAELNKSRSYKTARWQWLMTWVLVLWYSIMHLVTSVSKAIRGRAA